MKTFVRLAVTLLAVTVACQAGLALAEDSYYWVSSGDQSATQIGAEKVTGQGQSGSSSCCPGACCPEQSCGSSCGCLGGVADPPFGLVGSFGLDSFKGIADGDWPSNFGAVTALNSGILLPGVEDYGLGWQFGMSYGIYDFDGRASAPAELSHCQQQTFVTTGFYRKATGDQRLSFGLVYDWMWNTNWGEFGTDPVLGQWRVQVEYAVDDSNGIGVWGTKDDLGSNQLFIAIPPITVEHRALSQVNLFWHHKFVSTSADSWLYIGIPDHKRLDQSPPPWGGGSLGDWTIGASLIAPLSDRLALYANGSYMHPSASAGPYASFDAAYDVSMGVAWYFGGHARSSGLQGKTAFPYMPVANNTNFLVDQYAH
jgi:hypothetical protein